jgi:hypothetical protein
MEAAPSYAIGIDVMREEGALYLLHLSVPPFPFGTCSAAAHPAPGQPGCMTRRWPYLRFEMAMCARKRAHEWIVAGWMRGKA